MLDTRVRESCRLPPGGSIQHRSRGFMAFRPRALRRVLVGGAVVALSTVFLAPMARRRSVLERPNLEPRPTWCRRSRMGGREGQRRGDGLSLGDRGQRHADQDRPQRHRSVARRRCVGLDAYARRPRRGWDHAPPDTPGIRSPRRVDAEGRRGRSAGHRGWRHEDALIHAEAGPVPTVELPWQGGGPVSESEGDCTLDLFSVIHIPLATDLKV